MEETRQLPLFSFKVGDRVQADGVYILEGGDPIGTVAEVGNTIIKVKLDNGYEVWVRDTQLRKEEK